MKLIFPIDHIYFTIAEIAKLNKISHRRAERILNDLVYLNKLEKKMPLYNQREKYWYFKKDN